MANTGAGGGVGDGVGTATLGSRTGRTSARRHVARTPRPAEDAHVSRRTRRDVDSVAPGARSWFCSYFSSPIPNLILMIGRYHWSSRSRGQTPFAPTVSNAPTMNI